MTTIELIEKYGIIPQVKIALTAEQIALVAKALKAGGLDIMEISAEAENAMELVKAVKDSCEMIVGLGSVYTAAQVEEAKAAGAEFITTNSVIAEVSEACAAAEMCLIPGVATPTEIKAAKMAGFEVVKYFPVENLQVLADVTNAYPCMKFVVESGAISEENLHLYLHTPGVLAVTGSWIVKNDDCCAIAKCSRASVLAIFQYVFEHVGINYYDVPSMEPTVFKIADMFNLKLGDTGSSTFVGENLELTKEKYRGVHGHIGFRTDDIVRSVFYFEKAGIEFEEGSQRYYKGGLHVIYFKEQWGDFAWHLQTNNTHNPPRWEDAEVVSARGGLTNKYIGKFN